MFFIGGIKMIKQEILGNSKRGRINDNVFNALRKRGIILLGPMDQKQSKEIILSVSVIKEVASFCIGSGSESFLVLRYKQFVRIMNVGQVLQIGNKAYQRGDYIACVKAYRQLLQYGNPKPFVYARLGLAYMKLFKLELAIDYLIVASELSKTTESSFDFTDLIGRLKEQLKINNVKPNMNTPKRKIEDTKQMDYSNISMEQVFNLLDSGMTVDEVCFHMQLNEEQKGYIILILAKTSYLSDNDTMGNYYLKQFEKHKQKTNTTQSLFEEIIRNKRFYKNRNIK